MRTGPVNQALVGQTALQDLDTIIAYAGSIGLRVILDNHRSEAGNSNEANGLWYTSAYPQANWIADWKTMATRYSASTFTFNGNPTVIGMDLRNEPHLIANWRLHRLLLDRGYRDQRLHRLPAASQRKTGR